MLLSELFNEYIKEIELEVKGTTLDSKMYRLKKLSMVFGEREVQDITNEDIKQYQRQLLYYEKLGADYINRLIGLLKQVFEYAKEKGYIERNILYGVKKIKEQYILEKKNEFWTIEVFNAFDEVIEDYEDKIIFEMLFFLGLRKGELIALKWENINLEKKELYITSTAVQRKEIGQIVTTPKTTNSVRTIPLHDLLSKKLQDHYLIKRSKHKYVNRLYVFGEEKMISFSALDRKWKRYIELSNVPKIKLHGLRHSHATMLAQCTSDIKSISERLGDTMEVTVNVYIHSNTSAQRELANIVQREIDCHDESSTLVKFKNNLEKLILKEVGKEKYKKQEVDEMIEIYNYIKNVQNEVKSV